MQQLWWPMPPGCAGIDDFISFYDPEWVDRGIELAPLHMGLRLAPYEFPRLRRDTFSGRPPLLADARPDKFGNALVNCWMAGQVVAPVDITPLDRLGYAADHVLGALEFRSPARDAVNQPPSAVLLADLAWPADGLQRHGGARR